MGKKKAMKDSEQSPKKEGPLKLVVSLNKNFSVNSAYSWNDSKELNLLLST